MLWPELSDSHRRERVRVNNVDWKGVGARQLSALCGDRWQTPNAIIHEGAITLTRTRKSAPTLTVQQRRREIIDLLADHLARMPEALDIPPSCPGSPPDSEHESAPQNLRRRSQIGLEHSAN